MKGNGSVFKRGQLWWIAYYENGKERRESSRSRERKEAVKLLRQRLGEVAFGVTPSVAPKQKKARSAMMQDLFDLLEQNHRLNNRTSKITGTCLRRLRRRFTGYTVQACTSLAITNFMATIQRAGRKAETINREIAVLRTALRLGYRHDLVSRVPAIKLMPQLAVRNEFFSRDEINALMPRLPEYLRDVVLFGFLTGWRKGEITGLRWSNVNRAEAVIRLNPEQNKSRDVRALTLHGELAALIERRWQTRKVGRALVPHVFHCAGRELGVFRDAWLTGCRNAGLGHRWFHSLRRSAARNMSLEGIPEKVIMSIMGHKTRGMFERYNIVTEADQRACAKRLYGP